MRKLPEKAVFMIKNERIINERIINDFMGDKYSYSIHREDGEIMEHVTMSDEEASAQVAAGSIQLLTDREYNRKFVW
jgi:hypothetical protein